MELAFIFASMIILSFFVTVIALVAIVFGQHTIANEAVKGLVDAIRTALGKQ